MVYQHNSNMDQSHCPGLDWFNWICRENHKYFSPTASRICKYSIRQNSVFFRHSVLCDKAPEYVVHLVYFGLKFTRCIMFNPDWTPIQQLFKLDYVYSSLQQLWTWWGGDGFRNCELVTFYRRWCFGHTALSSVLVIEHCPYSLLEA